jgi:hypothetical protein
MENEVMVTYCYISQSRYKHCCALANPGEIPFPQFPTTREKGRRWSCVRCWQLDSQFPTGVQGGAEFFKGSHRMGDGQIFLKLLRLSLS